MPKPRKHNSKAYKSGFEDKFATKCLEEGWNLDYEKDRVKYIVPESKHTYTPDFTVAKDIYVETKGLWTAVDRKKALLIKEQHPNVSILYVFYRNNRLSKKSSTTYMEWAEKNGLTCCLYSDDFIWKDFIHSNYKE